MAKYAYKTQVPVERSKAQIESLLIKYGANAYSQGWDVVLAKAVLSFRYEGVCFRFVVEKVEDDAQEERRRWRALHLIIKAQLEAVASGIVDFKTMFMPWILGANGKCLGETLTPQLETFTAKGRVQLMALPAPEK